MQSTTMSARENTALVWKLDELTLRRVFFQRKVRADLVVIVRVRSDRPSQMLLAEDDHVIQTFSPNRTDHAPRMRSAKAKPEH